MQHVRHLTAVVLLLSVFLMSLPSLAHDLQSGIMAEKCASHVLCDCGDVQDNDNPASPLHDTGGCCDEEECCHDSVEPPSPVLINRSAHQLKLFREHPAEALPEVYLAIIVPPES